MRIVEKNEARVSCTAHTVRHIRILRQLNKWNICGVSSRKAKTVTTIPIVLRI
jgi:hypothetical protein